MARISVAAVAVVALALAPAAQSALTRKAYAKAIQQVYDAFTRRGDVGDRLYPRALAVGANAAVTRGWLAYQARDWRDAARAYARLVPPPKARAANRAVVAAFTAGAAVLERLRGGVQVALTAAHLRELRAAYTTQVLPPFVRAVRVLNAAGFDIKD